MARLFVDTWGWLSLRDKGDSGHNEAVRVFSDDLERGSIVTTDYVLDETITLLFRRLIVPKAKESLEFLMAALSDGAITLAPIHTARFRETVKLRVKFKDKPEISLTDFTSMVVMQELGLERILTQDRHFMHVGLGFVLVP